MLEVERPPFKVLASKNTSVARVSVNATFLCEERLDDRTADTAGVLLPLSAVVCVDVFQQIRLPHKKTENEYWARETYY